jgi:DNA-binding beta-propeller fold protein YncE
MNRLAFALCASLLATAAVSAQTGPYKILSDTKVGGTGGFDYIYADSANRKLYIVRAGGDSPRISIFDLDTIAHVADIPATAGHGVVIDPSTGHGFASSNPVVMFDAKTSTQIKTIQLQGRPDGIADDPEMGRVYILSHVSPNVTVLDAKDGSILGTFEAGGAVEAGVFDGKGHFFVDLEDKGAIAVVDTKEMKTTGTISLAGKGDGCTGLAIDKKNGILFASCNEPNVMVMVDAKTQKVITTVPIGKGTDGATFNPATMEAFSFQGDGTLTVVKETSPTNFVVEQTLEVPKRARTITLDAKTGHVLSHTAEYGPAPAPQPGQRPTRPPMLPDSYQILVVGK